jgi:prepilin-type N-terminal cleavage/methylation domain-containing protein
MHSKTQPNRGFTLVELMVAMVIGLIVITAVYRVYQNQQQTYTSQRSIVEMQQNARAALTLMKREMRMAGYKPAATDGIDNDGLNGMDDADPAENGRSPGQEIGVVEALVDRITFRMDILPDDPTHCNNGVDDGGVSTIVDDPAECYDGLPDDPNEQITYALQPAASGNGNDLVRISSAGTGVLAYDIEAIAFGYAYDEDEDGALDTDNGQPDGNVIWAYDSGSGELDTNAETGGTVAGPALIGPNGPYIGAVRIWLLARTPHPLRGESDTRSYQVGDQVYDPDSYDPRYRRTLQVATVYCRNSRF